jgi:hypothetical protein
MKINLPTRREIRHANYGIAVAAVILVTGVLLVHEAGEGAIKAVGVIGFISALVVAHSLDALAERRDRREGKEPQ